jgi:hypothetical protein
MRRIISAAVLFVAILSVAAAPATARGHHHHRCRSGHVRRHHRCVRRHRRVSTAPARVRYGTKVDPSFTQSAGNPLAVTYAYSADATATVNGVVTDLAATGQLPAGVLNFYSQTTPGGGPEQLFCSMNVGGATTAGQCPITYAQPGTYDVTTQYVPDAGSAVTQTDAETISPYGTVVSLSATRTGCGNSSCDYELASAVTDQNGAAVPAQLSLTADPHCPPCGAIPNYSASTTIPTGSCSIVVTSTWIQSSDCGFELGNSADDAMSWTLTAAYAGTPGYTPSASAPATVSWMASS